jgi:hypothetical protein
LLFEKNYFKKKFFFLKRRSNFLQRLFLGYSIFRKFFFPSFKSLYEGGAVSVNNHNGNVFFSSKDIFIQCQTTFQGGVFLFYLIQGQIYLDQNVFYLTTAQDSGGVAYFIYINGQVLKNITCIDSNFLVRLA